MKRTGMRARDNTAGFCRDETGGGLGVLFIGISVVLLVLVVFLNMADYSVFTYKRNTISRAMDYGVTAAVQQINVDLSIEGVSRGFSEETGQKLLEGVEIDIASANGAFLTVFDKNCNWNGLNIDNNLLLCATVSQGGKLRYVIKSGNKPVLQGELDDPAMLEDRINTAMLQYWPEAEEPSRVYINGNPKTNVIENGTYLFALIRNVEIAGLQHTRKINLTSFAGAKPERSEKE